MILAACSSLSLGPAGRRALSLRTWLIKSRRSVCRSWSGALKEPMSAFLWVAALKAFSFLNCFRSMVFGWIRRLEKSAVLPPMESTPLQRYKMPWAQFPDGPAIAWAFLLGAMVSEA